MDGMENLGYEVLRITEDTPDLWNEVDAVLVGIHAQYREMAHE